jgi:Fur family ferric uptake transcriptional regulator
MVRTEHRWQDRLKKAGLRVTSPRLAILAALDAPGTHLDADGIAKAARERLGTLSTQSVYDSLHALVGAGLLRRIEPAGQPSLYEVRVGDNHHHLVCRGCGATVDVDCASGAAPCLEPCDAKGFTVDEAEVIYWGKCPACQVNQI